MKLLGAQIEPAPSGRLPPPGQQVEKKAAQQPEQMSPYVHSLFSCSQHGQQAQGEAERQKENPHVASGFQGSCSARQHTDKPEDARGRTHAEMPRPLYPGVDGITQGARKHEKRVSTLRA